MMCPHQTPFSASPLNHSPPPPTSISRALGQGLLPSFSPKAGASRGPKDIQGALKLVCTSCLLGASGEPAAGGRDAEGGGEEWLSHGPP